MQNKYLILFGFVINFSYICIRFLLEWNGNTHRKDWFSRSFINRKKHLMDTGYSPVCQFFNLSNFLFTFSSRDVKRIFRHNFI